MRTGKCTNSGSKAQQTVKHSYTCGDCDRNKDALKKAKIALNENLKELSDARNENEELSEAYNKLRIAHMKLRDNHGKLETEYASMCDIVEQLQRSP
jgi:GTP cyclohydrolase III